MARISVEMNYLFKAMLSISDEFILFQKITVASAAHLSETGPSLHSRFRF